jgi:hypothetical protein
VNGHPNLFWQICPKDTRSTNSLSSKSGAEMSLLFVKRIVLVNVLVRACHFSPQGIGGYFPRTTVANLATTTNTTTASESIPSKIALSRV